MEYINSLWKAIDGQDIFPDSRAIEDVPYPELVIGGKKFLCLCSNNYFGLSIHPKVKKAAIEGVERYGIGTCDSRLIAGNLKILEDLEKAIADFKREPAAVVFITGFMANVGAIKLFEVPEHEGQHIYQGRRWGDIGCMELCMDVSDLEDVVAMMQAKGVEIYLPPVEIDMGSGSKGRVAYIRDPDGTIIELAEVKTVAWVSLSTFMRLVMPLLKAYDRLTG